MKHKKLALLLAAILILGLLSGCKREGTKTVTEPRGDGKSISVVATIFPAYDWAKNVVGQVPGVELTLLADKGVDFHSYQPTVDDMYKVANCDVFIYVGGESDKWVSDALRQSTNKNQIALNLLELLGEAAKEEEHKEGMQGKADQEPELDEHVWLSLKNAKTLCAAIESALAQADADSAAEYEANLAAYCEKLDSLDARYAAAVEAAACKTLLVADRFPFRYLVDDYGLDYYAAFSGCSAETEASFETVRFLVEKLDELGLQHVMKIEGSTDGMARTIIDNSAAKSADILTLDSLQSVTARQVEAGTTYLGVMEANLEVLQKALS